MKKKVLFIFLLLTFTCFASNAGMPWESPLEKIMESLTGPVAKTMSILAVAGVSGAMMFGEMGGLMKKMLGIVAGIATLFVAVAWVPSFFNYSGSIIF